MIPTYAVIPTRNRPDVLAEGLNSIAKQVEQVFVIDSAREGERDAIDLATGNITVIGKAQTEVNLSALWNEGIRAAATVAKQTWDKWNVAVLNDDAIVPDGWVEYVAEGMRAHGAAAACTEWAGNLNVAMMHVEPGPIGLTTRMTGWAFMLAGEFEKLRADEQFQWWFGDDDLDWRARQAGGMVMLPGYKVTNRFPNGLMTPELHEQANRDAAAFEAKWHGLRPW